MQGGGFNTQPPEGGWSVFRVQLRLTTGFQHTAARRRLANTIMQDNPEDGVSTHSRPKAAGPTFAVSAKDRTGFNTQPPEGGWLLVGERVSFVSCFNTQPPEGGWESPQLLNIITNLFQHTAARRRLGFVLVTEILDYKFQHTAARRRLACLYWFGMGISRFQHTAARRRLAEIRERLLQYQRVSTHSRPKAAGHRRRKGRLKHGFQHTAARRRLDQILRTFAAKT